MFAIGFALYILSMFIRHMFRHMGMHSELIYRDSDWFIAVPFLIGCLLMIISICKLAWQWLP